jgi:hypothetical protein
MSEFSISYHVRADDGREVQKLLRHAKVAGVTFGPAKGWLTIVPYAESSQYRNEGGPRFADYLSKLTGVTTLHYCYAEDHGWTFALARANRPLVQFACWWDPSPTVERDQFDPLALLPLVKLDLVEPLLRSFDAKEAMSAQPAYRFAELLAFLPTSGSRLNWPSIIRLISLNRAVASSEPSRPARRCGSSFRQIGKSHCPNPISAHARHWTSSFHSWLGSDHLGA